MTHQRLANAGLGITSQRKPEKFASTNSSPNLDVGERVDEILGRARVSLE
jgi:hypothetical protein